MFYTLRFKLFKKKTNHDVLCKMKVLFKVLLLLRVVTTYYLVVNIIHYV